MIEDWVMSNTGEFADGAAAGLALCVGVALGVLGVVAGDFAHFGGGELGDLVVEAERVVGVDGRGVVLPVAGVGADWGEV